MGTDQGMDIYIICLSVGVYEHVVYVVICYMSVICYMPVMSSSRVLLKKHW